MSKDQAVAKEKVFGVKLAVADHKLVLGACKKLGVELEKGAALEVAIGALVGHFRKNYKTEELLKCDACNGVSTAAFEACPYCGSSEDETPADPKPKPKATEEPKAEKVVELKKPEPKAPATPAAAPAAGKAEPPKPAEVKAVEVKAELVKAPDDALAGLTSKDLDYAVTEITRLKSNTASATWELGAKLREVHERQLWKLRAGKDGKPTHRSFEGFCAAEVKISGTQCYALIDIADKYSPEKVRELGTSRLKLLLQAPAEDRVALEKDAKSMSTRKLQEKVKKLRAEKGAPADKARTAKRATPKGKGRTSEHITIAAVLGKSTIPLFKKPATKGEDPVPAKRLADLPFGVFDLANGVRMVFVLTQNANNHLQLKVECKRVEI